MGTDRQDIANIHSVAVKNIKKHFMFFNVYIIFALFKGQLPFEQTY